MIANVCARVYDIGRHRVILFKIDDVKVLQLLPVVNRCELARQINDVSWWPIGRAMLLTVMRNSRQRAHIYARYAFVWLFYRWRGSGVILCVCCVILCVWCWVMAVSVLWFCRLCICFVVV